MTLGERAANVIPAYGFWNFQFHQSESAYVEFEWEVPRGAALGLFARKNAVPSLTQADVRDVIEGNNNEERISKRETTVSF